MKPQNPSNPWKTLSTKVIYENAWIRVREDQVIRPDGKDGIYGVVDTRIATGVIALTPENQIHLVGQFRYPTNEYSWEIVEGGTDDNESPLDAAKRELREEAGLIAENWSQLGGEIHLSNCFSSERAFVFLATALTETEREPDGTEVLEQLVVPLPQSLEMVNLGEIKDALSVIGILRAAQMFQK